MPCYDAPKSVPAILAVVISTQVHRRRHFHVATICLGSYSLVPRHHVLGFPFSRSALPPPPVLLHRTPTRHAHPPHSQRLSPRIFCLALTFHRCRLAAQTLNPTTRDRTKSRPADSAREYIKPTHPYLNPLFFFAAIVQETISVANPQH